MASPPANLPLNPALGINDFDGLILPLAQNTQDGPMVSDRPPNDLNLGRGQ
jgi:hypothetical protein